MDVLSYLMAAPETRVVVFLLGWVGGVVVAACIALVVSR